MKMNDSRRRASGNQIMAHRHEIAEQGLSATTDRSLDSFEHDSPINLPVEKDDRTLRLDDFIFLSDTTRCWLIRTAEIWFLEACGDQTRVQIQEAAVLVRRLLPECERRLDGSTFFRATRDCVINLLHVRQTRLLDSSRVLFVLPTGKEVVVSGRQNVLFRKMRAL
jgi:DNA-binding LytR/AlgR family response regulator